MKQYIISLSVIVEAPSVERARKIVNSCAKTIEDTTSFKDVNTRVDEV